MQREYQGVLESLDHAVISMGQADIKYFNSKGLLTLKTAAQQCEGKSEKLLADLNDRIQ